MQIHKLELGSFGANCYIVESASKNAMILDAGGEPQRVLDLLAEKGLTAKWLVFTHGHFDHIGAASGIKDATGAKTAITEADRWLFLDPKGVGDIFPPAEYRVYRPEEPDILLKDGDMITLDELTFTVMMTPGHSKGSCCIMGEGVLFSGDTIFMGSIGRLDLKTGSIADMRETLKKFKEMKENVRILPGHGPETTLEFEQRRNPYLAY